MEEFLEAYQLGAGGALMQRIRKDDTVVVIAGKDKGKSGKVLRVLPEAERVVVEGVNIVVKNTKPRRQHETGSRVRVEAPIHLSNVQMADPKDGAPTRVGVKTLENGNRVRFAIKSGEQIDK